MWLYHTFADHFSPLKTVLNRYEITTAAQLYSNTKLILYHLRVKINLPIYANLRASKLRDVLYQ